MTFKEIKEKLNNAGSYEDIENTISLIKDPKLRTQMQEFANECEWENQDIKLVCIVLIEKFLDPKIDNNQLNELKETKTLPNISKFIYNLDQVDEDDKGIKEGAWSVNDYTKDRLGNKIIIVSQNGISNLTAKDIKSSVEQAYPQLSGQITANEKSIWFYLKPIKGLKESKKKSDFDKLSDKISKEYIKKGMSKSKAEEIGNATAAKIARSKKTESEESNKEFTLEDVDKVAEELNLTFDKFTKEELLTGMNIELEHGTKFPETNVTDDDLIMTAKIALAHLNEYSNYYDEDVGLHNFERELEAALSNKEDKIKENKKITESDDNRKIKIGSKVYWIGAGNEISAEGEVIDFPVDGRMTIKWDDNEQNTYDVTHPNIILADNYDDSVNESEKITESNEEEENPYKNIKVYMNTWGNYNEYGADVESIKGGWMTPDEALEWLDKQEIQEEEPFINDVDGKLPFEVDEYSNPKQVLEQIKDLQSLSEDEAKALSAIMESQNDNYEMCKEILDSGDYIFFPDVSDDDELGHAYVDMVGVMGVSNPEKYINQNEIEEEIRNSLEDSETEYSDEMISELAEEEIENNKNNEEYLDNHFDYEALGRDLDMDGYYFADTGAIYVM